MNEIKIHDKKTILGDIAKKEFMNKADHFKDGNSSEEARHSLTLDLLKYHHEEILRKITILQNKCIDRIKNNKTIQSLVKSLIENENTYIKEKSKFINSNSLNLEQGDLLTYWKTFQNNFFLMNRLNSQLVEVFLFVLRLK